LYDKNSNKQQFYNTIQSPPKLANLKHLKDFALVH